MNRIERARQKLRNDPICQLYSRISFPKSKDSKCDSCIHQVTFGHSMMACCELYEKKTFIYDVGTLKIGLCEDAVESDSCKYEKSGET